MINQPLVSVVLVIRDIERFLPEAIESVLTQTFEDFEFFIVDFGSKDRSKEIALDYASRDQRVKVSQIAPCSYIEAKIAACMLPRSRYLAIQDADDISLPDRLKAEVDYLERNPAVGLLGGAVQWIDSAGNSIDSADDYPSQNEEIQRELIVRNTFWHPTVLMRRDAYESVGGYRRVFVQSDDYDLWLRIAEHYQCANLKEKVLKYRIHPQQLSFRKRKDQILCALAAQAAASLRRAGKQDPLNAAPEISPSLLAEMGVSITEQKRSLASGYDGYIRHMFDAGSYSAVQDSIAEMLEVCQGYLDPRQVSEMHILGAEAAWKQGKIVGSLKAIGQAVQARPRVLGRPLRSLVDRVRYSLQS